MLTQQRYTVKNSQNKKTSDSYLLFETIIAVSMFFSIIIVVLKTLNFSNNNLKRSLQNFTSICQVADFYNENLNTTELTGKTVSFGGVDFVKIPVKTDMGEKYVFIKK